jgi:nucleoside-triphosphatase THEP1
VIHILTGPVHSGKTSLLQRVTAHLKNQNIAISGYLSLCVQENEKFIGYDLYDLKLDTQAPFIRKKGKEHWQRIGVYFFIPETLDYAQNIILHSDEADFCIIDEVGPLELETKGVWPALEKVLAFPTPDYVLVVRDTILKDWVEYLGQSRTKIYNISDKELYSKMIQYLGKKSTKLS